MPRTLGVADLQSAGRDQFVSSLFQAHSPALLRLAIVLVGDQPSAEDVVQDAFIGLHRAELRNAEKALPYVNGDGYLMPDPSGRYLLVLGFGAGNTAVLDVASHRLSVAPVRYPLPPLGAAW